MNQANTPPRRSRVLLSAEPLEDRSLPSGNVSAVVTGGVLRLDGDGLANQIRVSGREDGEVVLIPIGDTTINGGTAAVILGGIVFSYEIRMGGGDDFLWVTDTQDEIALLVDMNDGNDGLTVDFAGHTGTTVLVMGAGNDTVSLGMGEFEGFTIIDTGTGDDRLFIGGTEFGAVSFAGGAGVNSASLVDVKWSGPPSMTGFQAVYSSFMPTANPDQATARRGAAVTIDVAANDLAPGGTLDPASIQITAQPQHGTVRLNADGTLTYTADDSDATADSFRYTIGTAAGVVSNETVVSLVLTGGQTPPPQTNGPVPTITPGATSPTNRTSIPFTVTFNRDVTGFTASDVTVTNGTVSGFAATNSRTFTFNVAPTADGTVRVTLAAGAATDSAGRPSAQATSSITVDRTAPTATIRTNSSSNTSVIPFTISFSENVTGFTAADLTVTGGTVSGFTSSNARNYTFNVTPTSGASLVRVNVAAGAATDEAGNSSVAVPEFTTTTDRTDAGMTSTTTPPSPNDPNWQTQASGLRVWDIQTGTGPAVTSASTIGVFYTGWLLDGTVFDSGRTAGSPVSFPLTGLIAGWQQGIPGMQPGGIRRLYVPSDLAYGSTGTATIPPNSDLIFEIKLISVT